jgi:PPOX class probable F420-dependent enzyme
MSRAERERYLAEPHVAVLAITGEGRAPVMAPVWYVYEPGGEVVFVTHTDSRKGRRLAAERRATLLVQSEALPYRHVAVEGSVTLAPFNDRALAHTLGVRYLGPGLGEQYGDALMHMVDAIVRLRPERWTAAYSPMGAVQ